MSCTFTNNIGLECKDAIGGIKKIWVGDWSVNQGFFNSPVNGVTDYTVNDLVGITIECPPQTGSFEETINFNRDNGTVFYTQTINVMVHKLTGSNGYADKRNDLEGLAKARVIAIVFDNNNNQWVCGYDMPMDLSTATASTGKALGDMSGYTLALVGESPNRAYLVD